MIIPTGVNPGFSYAFDDLYASCEIYDLTDFIMLAYHMIHLIGLTS
jgi:hypothetical protein